MIIIKTSLLFTNKKFAILSKNNYFCALFCQTNLIKVMEQKKRIQSALVSVFNKDGLEPIIQKMNDLGITMYSTGGTEAFIKSLNIPVVAVEDITQYPSKGVLS